MTFPGAVVIESASDVSPLTWTCAQFHKSARFGNTAMAFTAIVGSGFGAAVKGVNSSGVSTISAIYGRMRSPLGAAGVNIRGKSGASNSIPHR